MQSLQRSNSGSSLLSGSGSFSGSAQRLQRSFSGSSLTSSMNKAGKMFDKAGLTGARFANTDQAIQEEEVGEWRYLVVDGSGIRPREDASYQSESKRRDCGRIKEGTVVEIDRRRNSGWTNWLYLKSGEGWLFDVSPKDKKVRLVEVERAIGEWRYESSMERAPILTAPSMKQASQASKSVPSRFVSPGEVITVMERIRPLQMKGTFLRLADGRGWAVDFLDGRQVLQRVAATQAHATNASNNVETVQFGGGAPSQCWGSDGSNIQNFEKDSQTAQLGAPELGVWDYVVIDPNGVSLRSGPTYSQAQKIPKRVDEGEIVSVVERRKGDGTTFLKLSSPQGWAFDLQPGGKSRLRLMEVNVERGRWYYVVTTSNGIALRSRCSFSDTCKIGAGPQKGALLTVTMRVKVGETTFLYISEGGWVFDYKPGKRLVEGPLNAFEPPAATMRQVRSEEPHVVTNSAGSGIHDAPGLKYRRSPSHKDVDARYAPWGSVVQGHTINEDWLRVGDLFLPFRSNGQRILQKTDDCGVRLSTGPTDKLWAATKSLVLQNARVEVSLLVEVEGIRWARVLTVGGTMDGWMHERLLEEVQQPKAAAEMLGAARVVEQNMLVVQGQPMSPCHTCGSLHAGQHAFCERCQGNLSGGGGGGYAAPLQEVPSTPVVGIGGAPVFDEVRSFTPCAEALTPSASSGQPAGMFGPGGGCAEGGQSAGMFGPGRGCAGGTQPVGMSGPGGGYAAGGNTPGQEGVLTVRPAPAGQGWDQACGGA